MPLIVFKAGAILAMAIRLHDRPQVGAKMLALKITNHPRSGA